MVKQKTSIVIEEELWQNVKIHCIKEKIDISDWLEKVIKEKLKRK